MLEKALTRWTESHKLGPLRRQLQPHGLALFEHKPEHHYVPEYFGRSARKLSSGLDDPEFFPLAHEVWNQRRTFLYYNRLYTLYHAVRNVARRFPAGRLGILEAGVHRGGSTYFIAELAVRYAGDRVDFTAVDTFEGHAGEDLPDGSEGAHAPGDFKGPAAEEIRAYLGPYPFVDVREGRIQDVAPGLGTELHLVHADVDIHAPTRFTLDHAYEHLVVGGTVVVDDYGFRTCPGARRATDEFIDEHGDSFVMFPLDSGQALLVRTR